MRGLELAILLSGLLNFGQQILTAEIRSLAATVAIEHGEERVRSLPRDSLLCEVLQKKVSHNLNWASAVTDFVREIVTYPILLGLAELRLPDCDAMAVATTGLIGVLRLHGPVEDLEGGVGLLILLKSLLGAGRDWKLNRAGSSR